MKIYSFILIVMSLMFSGCDFFSDQEDVSPEKALKFYYQKQSKTTGNCDAGEGCLKINFEKIVFQEGYRPEKILQLNRWIDSLYFESEKDSSLDALVDKYLIEYDNLNLQISDYNLPWSVQRNLIMIESLPGLMTFELYDYKFRGGATETESVVYYHLDKHDLNYLNLDDFINPEFKVAFQQYVSIELKRKLELDEKENLEDLGFSCSEGLLELPENFKINHESLIFYFDKSDINPFYAQNLELSFKLQEIEPWLQSEQMFHLQQEAVL